MLLEHEKKSQNLKAIIFFVIGCILQVVVFYLTNYFSSIFSPEPKVVIVLSTILIIFGCVCWFSISIIIYSLKTIENKLTVEEVSNIIKDFECNGVTACTHCPTICCLSRAFDSPGFGISISQNEKEIYRLYTPLEISEIEKSHNTHRWKHIWIFSENLSTEIDAYGNIEPIPQMNINNGVKYVEFYINNKKESETIETRKRSMLNSVKESSRDNLSFFELNTDREYIGKNTLPLLCGSILLSDQDEPVSSMPHFVEGYLSMRKCLEDSPIYYKMPRCMLNEYANYFKEKLKS